MIFGVENTIRKSSDYLFWFSIGCYFVDQGSGDGCFLGRVEILAISLWTNFQISRCWTWRLPLLWTRSSRIPSSRRRSVWRNRKPKKDQFSARKTDRFHDLRLLSSDWRSWHSTGLRWFLLCYSPWWWNSGIRYKMERSSTIDVKGSIRWYLGKSVQIKDTRVCATQNFIGIVRHGDSSEDIDGKLSKVEYNGKEKYRARCEDEEFWRQARETWKRRSGQESKGTDRRWRRKRYLLPVERKRPVFERRPMQFPAWE